MTAAELWEARRACVLERLERSTLDDARGIMIPPLAPGLRSLCWFVHTLDNAELLEPLGLSPGFYDRNSQPYRAGARVTRIVVASLSDRIELIPIDEGRRLRPGTAVRWYRIRPPAA